MKHKIFIVLVTLSASLGMAQKSITWTDLSQVKFTPKFYASYGETFLYPDFSASVKALEGKQVKITGYFLGIDPSSNLFILSQGPMASCFFCGVGGPETAIELQFKNKEKFKTDDLVTITGTLKLNADDIMHFNYILTDCTGVHAD